MSLSLTEANPIRVPKWQSPPPDEIVWTRWGDDEFIAYHRPSGITHFLNAASAALITELLNEASDAATVARAFESAIGDSDWDEHVEEIVAMFVHLEHLGLIRRV